MDNRISRFVIGMLLCLAMTVVAVPPADAVDGLAIRSTTSFVVDPVDESIRVDATYSVTNVTPDRRTSRGITQYYYSGLSVPVPAEAVDVGAVRSDGRTLNVSFDEEDADQFSRFAAVSFGRNVFYRKTTTFTVSYRLPSGAARSDDSGVRVNPAYAVFGAYGVGDPNAVTVRVEVPADFDVTVEGGSAELVEQDGVKVYEVADIENPEDFFLFVVARNDDALSRRVVDIGDDRKVEILHWPGDTEWADFVENELETGFVELQELIGQPFEDQNLEIIESVDPSLQGYAGWYIPEDELIEVSEDLDRSLILHELSHAWFNGDLFQERWITEGLAEEYSSRALEASGERLDWPAAPWGSEKDRQQLNRWNPFVVPEDERFEVERYGYNTSWYVIRQLTDEIGVEAMSEVIDSVMDGVTAYPGDGEAEPATGIDNNWRRFLDLLQEQEESEEAEDLFRKFVVTDSQKTVLDRRAEVRLRYQEVQTEGAEWAPPVGLRELMTIWRFVDIDDSFDAISETLAARDQLAEQSNPLELTVPASLEASYEGAEEVEDLVDLTAELQGYELAAGTIATAEAEMAADRGVIERIGLIDTDYNPLLQSARSSFEAGSPQSAIGDAENLIAGFAAAQERGTERTLYAGAALLAFGMLVLAAVIWRRRRRTPEDESAPNSTLVEDKIGATATEVPAMEPASSWVAPELSASFGTTPREPGGAPPSSGS